VSASSLGGPLLLALDTSTSTASVAVFDGRRVLSETTWLAGREHSSRLLVEAEQALERIGRQTGELTGLVVARGPGSFTGVRVALSVAKGVAAALGIPAWGVSSLDALALAAGPSAPAVRAVLEAGRGRFATALYRDGRCVAGPRLATLEQLAAELVEPGLLLIGELDAVARERLGREADVVLADPALCLRRAGFAAALGWRQAQAGDPGQPAALDAIYVS